MTTFQELANSDYSVKCYTGATRMQSELSAAFNLVAPKDHWKNPIDCAYPHGADPSLLIDAIVHFTGSVPLLKVEQAGCGLRLTAAGYYATIGA